MLHRGTEKPLSQELIFGGAQLCGLATILRESSWPRVQFDKQIICHSVSVSESLAESPHRPKASDLQNPEYC